MAGGMAVVAAPASAAATRPGSRWDSGAVGTAVRRRRAGATGIRQVAAPGFIAALSGLPSTAQESPMSLFDLSGRVAIVTGGNGGIGLGMAKGLAAAGAAVVVAARNREKSERAVGELCALGVLSSFMPLDVADPQSCRAMVAEAAERFGRLDILVNNAGMSIRKPPESYAVEEWQR